MNAKVTIDSRSWLDQLEDFEDTITVSNPGGAGGVALNSGAGTGWAYPNTITGSNGPYTYTSGTSIYQDPWATTSTKSMIGGQLSLEGEGADLKINGKSITDTIAKLEERLNILNVNEKLEADWEELRLLGNKYRELEAHIQAKIKTFETLKKYDEPN